MGHKISFDHAIRKLVLISLLEQCNELSSVSLLHDQHMCSLLLSLQSDNLSFTVQNGAQYATTRVLDLLAIRFEG